MRNNYYKLHNYGLKECLACPLDKCIFDTKNSDYTLCSIGLIPDNIKVSQEELKKLKYYKEKIK